MVTNRDVIDALSEIGVLLEDSAEPAGYKVDVLESFTYISTVIELEEMFGIEFEDQYLTGTLFDSIDELVQIINMLKKSYSEINKESNL